MREQGKSLLAGAVLGFGLATALLRPIGAAEPRVIVGLKEPATPAIVKELARELKGRIVRVGPGGAFILVVPKRGTTNEQLRASSPRISYVESDVAMGVPDAGHELLLVVPFHRVPASLGSPKITLPPARTPAPPAKDTPKR